MQNWQWAHLTRDSVAFEKMADSSFVFICSSSRTVAPLPSPHAASWCTWRYPLLWLSALRSPCDVHRTTWIADVHVSFNFYSFGTVLQPSYFFISTPPPHPDCFSLYCAVFLMLDVVANITLIFFLFGLFCWTTSDIVCDFRELNN